MTPDVTKDSLHRISKVFRKEPDRSAAILGAALLDDQLDGLLRTFLCTNKETDDLFKHNGPLATFSGRNAMAYALGLIPKDVWRDIDKVRDIRNKFAHRIEGIAFDSQPVRNVANSLYAAQWILDHDHLAEKPIEPEEFASIDKSPRRRFELTVALVSLALDGHHVAMIPKKIKCQSPKNIFGKTSAP